MSYYIKKISKNFCVENIASFLEMNELDFSWDHESFLSDLPKKWDTSLCLEKDGKIIGYAFCSEKEESIHLHRLLVEKSKRSMGIGVYLLLEIEKNLKNLGINKPITLKVHKNNMKARSFYERYGFKVSQGNISENSEYVFMKADMKKSFSFSVHQPNFFPWIGYFNKINLSDFFVILDDVQMPNGRSYVSRTKIRAIHGEQWLSLPVKRNSFSLIKELKIDNDQMWKEKHLNVLKSIYKKAPFYKEGIDLIEKVYNENHSTLKALNMSFIKIACNLFGIDKPIILSSILNIKTKSDDRIIDIGKCLASDRYISGPGGDNYQTHSKFEYNNMYINVISHPDYFYEAESFPYIKGLGAIDAFMCVPKNALSEILDSRHLTKE